MFCNLSKAAGLFATLATLHAASAPWRFSNPQPHGNNILEMALADGVVWQIGDRGRLYTSADLDTWLPHETGITRSLRSITFFGGKVFISTEDGGILSGPDADHLTFKELGTTDWLEGIAASTTRVVAVGDNGAIYSSTDGANWVARGKFSDWLRSVAYGANQFVAVGEDGFIATSLDGETWDKKTSGTSAHLNKAVFLNDRFWIVGEGGTVLTNNFRMTFLPVNVGVTNTLFAVAGNTEEILVGGDSALLLGNPRNGTWSAQADANSATLAPLWPYYSALWDGRLFLAAGRTGLKVEGFRTNATAALEWFTDPQATRNWLWAATRATDFYAACGTEGTIVTSQDGIDWVREFVPSSAANQVLLGIGGNTNALIAVGTGGTILRAPNLVTNTFVTNAAGEVVTEPASLFGVIWESSSSPTTDDLQGVAANDSSFLVAGAKGALFTSADGISWQPRSSGVTNFLSGATAWPQGWVVSGTAGAILTSGDGASWTRQNSGASEWVYQVRYVGGTLIAVGENGLILTSTDGARWERRTSGTTEWLNDATFVPGSGWQIAADSGLILSSPDAARWTVTRAITSKSLYSAVTDGAQLVMAGVEGVIVHQQTAPGTSPVNFVSVANTSGSTLFLFAGLADQRFQLEGKVHLEDAWAPIVPLEIVSTGGTLIYELPKDNSSVRFFRTRLLTP